MGKSVSSSQKMVSLETRKRKQVVIWEDHGMRCLESYKLSNPLINVLPRKEIYNKDYVVNQEVNSTWSQGWKSNV